MNEHQLAIGETTFGGKRELKSDDGIIDCPELYRLVLERARTAREAIRIADELTKLYGYNDYGEAFTFADKDEVWFFEIMGPGRGKKGAVWAAVRIPDDEVAVSANAPRIRKIDLKDPEHLHGLGQHPLAGRGAGVVEREERRAVRVLHGVRLAQRAGQPAPRVARAQPPGAVAAARSERRALPAVGEAREAAVGEGRVRHLPRHLRGHPVRHDADAAQGGPRREGREEPGGQPVHEQRLPRPAEGALRAHHRLQARHLPVGDPVAQVAARRHRRRRLARATTTR